MTIKAGDKLPEGALMRLDQNGRPETVGMDQLAQGRIVLFGLPGAYTGTCSTAHIPSFIRTADQFRAKGVERIICLTVNDAFVADAWAKATGADKAGIEILADADGSVTRAMGLAFDAPPAGLYGRCQRCAMLATDGVLEVIQIEDSPGQCTISGGEALLEHA
ncbi:peroxiredoxin [Paracoccus sp. M683]|uniref:peroxiredoxin n=1 Tax=Paracoccus sp. M683 TaxID=2594268 RepID=UPI00117DF644|nr:peroxiredoxin [Paracoccus sp. M683]TRW99362.1 peroxiredoxin [Paracoccus sp. M683]